jgi:hypothetical protein
MDSFFSPSFQWRVYLRGFDNGHLRFDNLFIVPSLLFSSLLSPQGSICLANLTIFYLLISFNITADYSE